MDNLRNQKHTSS
jgi:hypothetical protein